MIQIVLQIYYLFQFDPKVLIFNNVIPEFIIFLQLNPYYKIIIKFLMKNIHEEHYTMFKRTVKA